MLYVVITQPTTLHYLYILIDTCSMVVLYSQAVRYTGIIHLVVQSGRIYGSLTNQHQRDCVLTSILMSAGDHHGTF